MTQLIKFFLRPYHHSRSLIVASSGAVGTNYTPTYYFLGF
jgi:hypothetical protein